MRVGAHVQHVGGWDGRIRQARGQEAVPVLAPLPSSPQLSPASPPPSTPPAAPGPGMRAARGPPQSGPRCRCQAPRAGQRAGRWPGGASQPLQGRAGEQGSRLGGGRGKGATGSRSAGAATGLRPLHPCCSKAQQSHAGMCHPVPGQHPAPGQRTRLVVSLVHEARQGGEGAAGSRGSRGSRV